MFVKVRYNDNNFVLAGSSFSINYRSKSNLSNLKGTISDKVDELFETYNINDDQVVHLIIYFVRLDKKFVPNLLLNLDQNPYSKLSFIHKEKNFPVSLNDKSLGPALDNLAV